MANNLNQFSYPDDSLDLREIFKILLESKKILISTLLFFTISSFFYSLNLKPEFKSSTVIEIGYSEIPDGTQTLIENSSDIISDLKVLIMKNPDNKFTQDVSINSLEGKLIILKTTSSSVEQNENLFTEMISYIIERHSNLAALSIDHQKNQISNKIDLFKSEISFLKKNMRVNLEAKILKLQRNLPIIDQEISQLGQVITQDTNNLNLLKGSTLAVERASISPTLEQVISSYKSQINQLKRERNSSISDLSILSKKLDDLDKDTLPSEELFSLEQNRKILENQLQTLINSTQVKTHLIENIKTENIKPKILLTILLGIIMGFITGILLVYIRNFVKSFRESEA
jgi:capsular polysaccharide biosynthesis protein